MIEKYFDGIIPSCSEETELDSELKQLALETPGRVEKLMDELLFSNALQEIWKLVSRSNKYIDETTPWLLAKSESDGPRLGTVLYNLAESLRFISVLISPFMTRTPPRIQEQLGISSSGDSTWESLKEFGRLKAGSRVKRGEVIFPRLDPEKELEALEALRQEKLQEETVRAAADKAEKEDSDSRQAPDILPEITIDDFAKVDLRVARVVKAERVEKADKLLKLTLDVGGKSRQVVSGIAQHYSPEELEGMSVILVANLKPVKLRGILSEGMILAASDERGKLVLVTASEEIESGSQVR
jgi:methionyl-tRNA synthetase